MAGKAQNLVWMKPLSDLPVDTVVLLVDGAYLLAEGVVWCSRKQELWWVDIEGKKIMRLFSPGDGGEGALSTEGWDVPTRPGSIALREGGGREPDCPLLVSFEDGFSLYNPSTGKRVPAAATGEPDEYEQLPHTRLNDGRCDRGGRFICGGLNQEHIDAPVDVWKPRAGVFRLENGKGVRRILPDEEFRCYNSTCFSVDGNMMYATDTPLKKIACYDYNSETGEVSNKRAFVDLKDGFPDGATVDAEGCLWVALYGSGAVRRYSPTGELLRTIEVPGAKRITCVAFGGPELDILFITSASVGLDDRQRLEQPNAGAVFAVKLEGVRGISECFYRG
eukprot:jgi/Undpi1/302/HiC_scaffold_1.g00298.m1